MMTQATVYGIPQSTYTRSALMMLKEKGVDHTLEPVELGSDALYALHPFGKIPAFKHGDVQLFETIAIGQYADGAFDGPSLQPADPVGQAKMSQWNSAIIDYVYPVAIKDYLLKKIFAPESGPDQAALQEAREKLGPQFDAMNAALGDSGYFAGSGPSIADYMAFPIIWYLRSDAEVGPMIAERHALADWADRMEQRESASTTVPPPPPSS
ncbi:MAG: glutathione S-transferase family protein [Pseudomonadota bacterium]